MTTLGTLYIIYNAEGNPQAVGCVEAKLAHQKYHFIMHEGTLAGEISYVLKKLINKSKCAACDITHGWSINEKKEWTECKLRLGCQVQQLHINELDDKVGVQNLEFVFLNYDPHSSHIDDRLCQRE